MRPPSQTVEWDESLPHALPATDLSEELAMAAHREHGRRIDIEFPSPRNGWEYRFKSRGFVGNLPVKGGLLLRIRPKVPIHNLFGMLEYAYDLGSFRCFDGTVDVAALDQVFETLAALLARRVLDRIRVGLHQGYVEEQEALPYVRGRVSIRDSLRAGWAGATRLSCEFEELTVSVDDNHILAWTLAQLHRFPFSREDVREQIRKAHRAMASTLEPRRMSPRDCIHRFYDRLNEDYRPLHALCRFFLEQSGPSFDQGEHALLPFTLHMPTLFESFVGRWLHRHLPDDLRLTTQHHADLEPSGRLHFKIDLVLTQKRTGQVLAVLDTKYKSPQLPDVDDIQQIVAYATRMRTRTAILIYPSRKTLRRTLEVGDVKVHTLLFDLDVPIGEAGASFLEELNRLREDVEAAEPSAR